MATAAKTANTSQSFSSKQPRAQTNLEVQPQPKSPESVRPALPLRVRCALARRDPEGPSGQCDKVIERLVHGIDTADNDDSRSSEM